MHLYNTYYINNFSNIFLKFLIIFLILTIKITYSNCFMFFDQYIQILSDNNYNNNNYNDDDFNINNIKNIIINEYTNHKKQIEQEKYKSIKEKEIQLKNKLSKIARINIIKQLEIDEENKKLEKYYKLMKDNYRKSINDELVKFIESKIN